MQCGYCDAHASLHHPYASASFEAWSPLRKGESRDSNDWMHEGLYEVLLQCGSRS